MTGPRDAVTASAPTRSPADPIRILIVDDSPTARAVLTKLCAADPDIDVVGEAADGKTAVELAARLRPTVILMDITMPGVGGYEATRQIMTKTPTRIIMVTAANDPHSVNVTLRALEVGALTVLAKPVGRLGTTVPETDEFVARVKLLSDVGVIGRHAPRTGLSAPPRAEQPRDRSSGIVAVAASTGGPAALQGLLGNLPVDFPMPVVVVQHIVKGFIPGLAEWLNVKVAVRVKVAIDGERLQNGTVYLAPDDHHLTVSRRRTVALQASPPVGGFRPSGNVLLASVAAACGPDAVAVVLTGMGSDGMEGARAVSERGGTVLAQDERTSVVFGMPRAVVAAGLANAVGPVESLARRLRALAPRRDQ